MSASAGAAIATSRPANNGGPLSLDASSRPVARRRKMVITEKIVNVDGVVNGVAEDKIIVNGKNLSHTIRGESVVRRSKDLSQLKKELISASARSTQRKKAALKQQKPRWQTVLSVLTKNCLLLAALLWLGYAVWRWNYRVGNNPNSPFAAMDFENRISEVEASLKKTAKMLQVQVDLVDKKIGSEIGILTKEFSKQLEGKKTLLENELKKLESRTDSLDSSLSKLKETDFLSREEFETHFSQLKNYGNLDGSDSNLDLDQIRAVARVIVEKEIEKHAADGLARVDYALASGGARVVRHSEPYGLGKAKSWFTNTKSQNRVNANAHKMLEPSFGEPGQCFPLQGSSGFVEIRLRTAIIPEAITLEHVSKSLAYDRSSAPKDCRVSAWFESPNQDPSSFSEEVLILAEFAYDLEKSNAQTFSVEATDSRVVNMVRLDFTSNHGSSSLTCIYRLRVHGYEPNSPGAMALQA